MIWPARCKGIVDGDGEAAVLFDDDAGQLDRLNRDRRPPVLNQGEGDMRGNSIENAT